MFHFTIRDVLWLTVFVALAAGWWVDHRWSAEQRLRLEVENVSLRLQVNGGSISGGWTLP